jgi:hypothetical protein
MEQTVESLLQQNDHIFVKMKSNDIWLSVNLKIEVENLRSFQTEFKIKISQIIKGKHLKMII